MTSILETSAVGNPGNQSLDSGLVTLNQGHPVTTTLAIAQGTENNHASVIKLVRTYQADLEEFGRVGFEIQPFETGGGTQSREVALLNEDQATLLITYMRNNAVVRRFKMRLVKAFRTLVERLRTPFQIPQTLGEALRLASELEEKRHSLACEVVELTPKAAFHDQVRASKDVVTVAAFAKILGTGQTRMFRWLRDAGYIIRSSNLPYQKYIDQGLFRTIEEFFEDAHGQDRLFVKTLITGKGQIELAKRYRAQGEPGKLRGIGC